MICSAVDPLELERIRRRIFLALFAALAVALHTLDALLPAPAPWFRLGIANILTLAALFLYGGRAAWIVTLTRIGVGSLVLGNLFSPGFLLSLAGGVLAVALMTGAKRLCGTRIGPVGVSVLGASAHAVGQVSIASWLLVRTEALWRLFPLFLIFAIGAGIANGLAADLLLEVLERHPAFDKARR
jgi:heptaprenyl diphosphate synthase